MKFPLQFVLHRAIKDVRKARQEIKPPVSTEGASSSSSFRENPALTLRLRDQILCRWKRQRALAPGKGSSAPCKDEAHRSAPRHPGMPHSPDAGQRRQHGLADGNGDPPASPERVTRGESTVRAGGQSTWSRISHPGRPATRRAATPLAPRRGASPGKGHVTPGRRAAPPSAEPGRGWQRPSPRDLMLPSNGRIPSPAVQRIEHPHGRGTRHASLRGRELGGKPTKLAQLFATGKYFIHLEKPLTMTFSHTYSSLGLTSLVPI